MSAAGPRAQVPPPRAGTRIRGPAWRFAAPWALVALTVAVWHRALLLYFSQDDFVYLGRARGLVPRIGQPWRWLSQEAVWDATRPFGIDTALPQHLLSLGVHLVAVLLLHHLLSRRLSRPAAFVGAVFFAVHPSSFHALYWASAIADPLQLAFALAALGFALRQDRACWFAVPAFAFSLVSKEGLVMLPAIVLLHRLGPGAAALGTLVPGPPAPRLRRIDVVLMALAAAFLAYFVTVAYPSRFGPVALAGGAVSEPYQVSFGPGIVANLVTYLGWTVNFALPTVRAFSDVVDPGMLPWGAVIVFSALAACAWPALRARGWVEGLGTYLGFLLPLLLLRNHTCHYYLYGALAGATICVAALADLAFTAPLARAPGRPRRAKPAARRPLSAWPAAVTIALLLALNGGLLIRKIELHPVGRGGLRADPVVDRALIARRTFESLRESGLPDGIRLLMWPPGPPGDTAREGPGYWDRNVEAAVAGGVGLAVMAPGLAGPVFVVMPRPLGDDERLGLIREDGSFHVAARAQAESLGRWAAARKHAGAGAAPR